MSSMYEKIMELPLFKGIGDEQLSSLLEKTSIGFINPVAGETLWKAGEPVKELGFILNGFVSRIHRLENFEIEIEEILGKGTVIGAENLYGLHISHLADTKAVTDAGIMVIGKDQYMKILRSDEIYLINYLNFLSAAGQRRARSFITCSGPSLSGNLRFIAANLASPMAAEIKINGEDSEIARALDIPLEDFLYWKKNLAAKDGFHPEDKSIIIKKANDRI